MFGRYNPRLIFDRLPAILWPRLGIRRAGQCFCRGISRINGFPRAIAAGLACGAMVSFLLVFGRHITLAVVLTFAIRGSLIVFAIGTVIGNPWIFPLIWIGRCLGMGQDGTIAEGEIKRILLGVCSDLSSGHFAKSALESWPVFGLILVSGSIVAIIFWHIVCKFVRKGAIVCQKWRQIKFGEGRACWRRSSEINAAEKGAV